MSWGWNQGLNSTNQSKNLDNSSRNPWGQGCQSIGSVKEKGWGVAGYDSWGNHWEINLHGSRNLDKGTNPPGKTFTQGSGPLKDRGWRDCGVQFLESEAVGESKRLLATKICSQNPVGSLLENLKKLTGKRALANHLAQRENKIWTLVSSFDSWGFKETDKGNLES
ncbi:hypothetical protein F0562_013381 [Nyssa sinensis]|uniref:Uncharacterized protein n=1 Tax=Nyssa sinensis TaxID=561372 RepID=A0A5J4ZKM0_9ASTE|nr:hypothetical protein F0562_013381 [Nyssa sinensis]